jgi:hypothetical protein
MRVNTFEFEAFAGAIYNLGKVLDETASKVGIPRPALADAFHKYYRGKKKRWEVDFWANAHSDQQLNEWIWKQKKPTFDWADEEEFFALSKRMPTQIREGLIEIAKCLPGRRGGKTRAFNMMEAWRVRSLVLKEREKGISKKSAYRKVAKEVKRSEHTIRRTCEPKERKRSRQRPDTYALLAT